MNIIEIGGLLEFFRGRKVDYLANHGNIGDMLIHKSTMILFSKFNIKINIINNAKQNSEILFVSGGGNLIKKYSYLLNHLKRVIDDYDEVIMLPHTYNGNDVISFLKSNQQKVRIICRELYSYRILENSGISTSKLFLADDLALCMNLDVFEMKEIGTLHAFREDIERTNALITHDNCDLSMIIKIDNSGFDLEFWNTMNWEEYLNIFIEILASYKVIHTNRLHIAIAAALLDKKVFLYPNSYYKNKGVYQFSLRKMKHVRMRTKIQQIIYVWFFNFKNIVSNKLYAGRLR